MSVRATSKSEPSQNWDVAVIGGGPAGMMAAGRAAERGATVILIEKNKSLGKKLLITGGGRCNVTNAETDNKKFLAKFKDSGKFLFSPFSRWSVRETLDFFHVRQMATKEEEEQRVFPVSNTARSVHDTLQDYLKEHTVSILTNAAVRHLNQEGDVVTSVELRDGRVIRAASFILATGGTSHPETGSTGDGYSWLRTLGHSVSEARAGLVPLAVKQPDVTARAAGVSVKDAKITLYQNETKQAQSRGKILFTHVGLSGPAILNMSREIGDLLKYDAVTIEIDFMPEMGHEKVNVGLQLVFTEKANRKIRNSLQGLLAPGLIPVLLDAAGIDGETVCNSVTREARMRLIKQCKHFRVEADHLLGMEKAVITAGGVELTEIDFKTMRSLKYSNLFLVGDILNVDRPSGGYSLQLCWTTGFVAGDSVPLTYTKNIS